MAASWWWFIAAVVSIAAELMTGTFYLLAVGAALAVGGALALLGFDLTWQLGLTAVAMFVFVFGAHHWRAAKAQKVAPPMALDVGKRVHVESWGTGDNARVAYRGSTWDAELATPDVPRNQYLYICAVRGSVLVLSDREPA